MTDIYDEVQRAWGGDLRIKAPKLNVGDAVTVRTKDGNVFSYQVVKQENGQAWVSRTAG